MKLTKRAIELFTYDGGWDVRWDDDIPGFGLRIYPSGKKAFVLSYRAEGRKRLMVLGRFGADVTLDQARDAARKHRVHAREGIDPLELRHRAAKASTLGELIEAYIERHAKVHKRTWKADQNRLGRHVPRSWQSRKAASITRDEIADLHHRFGLRAPYEANRLLENLRKMFKLGRLWHFLEEGAPNPAEGIQKFREQKRKRWAHPEELPLLAREIDAEPNIYVRAAIWLAMLAGLRRGEFLAARWEDVDWSRSTLRLPQTKSGDEQEVALSAAAIMVLQSLPKVAGNPHIFPGGMPGRPLVNINKPWGRIRRAAGCEDLRVHDLRRTVGSWMSQDGVDLNTIKDALRHQNISTTLTYARLGADPARKAMEEHGRRILAAAGRSKPTAVDQI